MRTITEAQWHVTFLICGAVALLVAISTLIICSVVVRVVRAEARRIEQEWRKQREHDQKVMLEESQRLLRATAARRAVLSDTLDDLLPPAERRAGEH